MAGSGRTGLLTRQVESGVVEDVNKASLRERIVAAAHSSMAGGCMKWLWHGWLPCKPVCAHHAHESTGWEARCCLLCYRYGESDCSETRPVFSLTLLGANGK